MAEPVRLVIWDLDDTFWRGTLAEGSIAHLSDTQGIVRELALRGILSSICSRNDFEQVKAVLSAQGIWDFFVFPSISWEPKGPRIRGLVEAIQLRPATILFLDDNPSNLQEARHFNPELQLAGVEFIPRMLEDPSLAGKPDPDLARLRQYRALEQRKVDEAKAEDGVESFLRQSDIQIGIRHDLADSLDRIVELINRTNQLNFTKRRLPDEPDAARAQLAELLQSHDVQAGLLHVLDRYGDHGDAGFYLVRNNSELLHFCFSCRILGMGVEAWLYRRLGRPKLAVSGQVMSDPVRDTREIDWIRLVEHSTPLDATKANKHRFDWVAARGGCDLQALSHYFRVGCQELIGEFNVGRNGFDARTDHSVFLRYALESLSGEVIHEASRLGYRTEDFRTVLNCPHQGAGLIILSFWSDVSYALYRHRRLGFTVPFALSGRADHRRDARTATVDELPEQMRRGWLAQALETLQSEYDYLGPIGEEAFKNHLGVILRALPPDVPVVLLQSNTRLRDAREGVTHTSDANVQLNQWLRDCAPLHPRSVLVDIREAVHSENEVADWTHFDRLVYFRLYQRICEKVA